MPDESEIERRSVPLFELNRRGWWGGRAKVAKAVILEFQRSSQPLSPYGLAGLLIDRGVYRGRRKRALVSHVRNVVKGMASRSVVEFAGMAPGKKWGMQETYRLTAYGRMVSRLLLIGDPPPPADEQRQALLDFITKYCKTGSRLTDFDFDVMIEMLNGEYLGTLIRFFQFGVIQFSVGSLTRPSKGWIRNLDETWTWLMGFPDDDPVYARAFLKVFGSLPEDGKRIISMYVKTRRERDWLLGIPPDERYVEAVARGGDLVHLPMRCLKCRETVVAEKSVEGMYRDVAMAAQTRCPKCGSALGWPKWDPWYVEGTGKV